jgi:IS30 family transposase
MKNLKLTSPLTTWVVVNTFIKQDWSPEQISNRLYEEQGLIRQYLQKSRPLNNVTQKQLDYIMVQLNHPPRKTLGFKTSYELFFKKKTFLTVALHS